MCRSSHPRVARRLVFGAWVELLHERKALALSEGRAHRRWGAWSIRRALSQAALHRPSLPRARAPSVWLETIAKMASGQVW